MDLGKLGILNIIIILFANVKNFSIGLSEARR